MITSRDAVIVAAIRTPVGVGKPDRGELAGWHPAELSAQVLTALADRTGLDPAEVDDVIWGCVSQVGEQSFNVGRNAVLAAGWPETVPATTIDRQCGSSQQSVHFATAGVISGQNDVVVAGGVEVMSRVPMFSSIGDGDPYGAQIHARYPLTNQGIAAERIAAKWRLSRTQLDELAATSHSRAAEATRDGLFGDEILAVEGASGPFTTDQGIRPTTTVKGLAGLRPAFKEDGVVTAGNSSQISDGAAALLVTTSEIAAQRGWQPLARVHTAVVAGVDPIMMLTGPIPATAKALDRAGLSVADIDAFEVNEAFASVLGAWYAETGADPALTNPVGGAMALGHPLGASGARLMTTLVHHLRRTGGRYGLQTMCEGGGMANATIVERL